MPKQTNMRKKSLQITIEFILSWKSTGEHGLDLSMVYITSEMPLEKTKFSLQVALTEDKFLATTEYPCQHPHLNTGNSIWLEPVQALFLLPQSLGVHSSSVGSERHCSLFIIYPL